MAEDRELLLLLLLLIIISVFSLKPSLGVTEDAFVNSSYTPLAAPLEPVQNQAAARCMCPF